MIDDERLKQIIKIADEWSGEILAYRTATIKSMAEELLKLREFKKALEETKKPSNEKQSPYCWYAPGAPGKGNFR